MFDAATRSRMQIAKLRDVAALNPRFDSRLEPHELVSFVPMAAVSARTATVETEELRPYASVTKGYTAFADGDVLVAKITPCFENNKIAQARLSTPIGFGSTEFHVVRPNPTRLDARYALHFLRQDHIRAEGERKMTGSAGQRRVPEHVLANLEFPLPPLSEQRRIAAILDEADALRAKRRAVLVNLKELASSIFVEMFGDIRANSRDWPTIQLGNALAIPLRNGVSPATDGKVALEVLTLSAITGQRFDVTARKEGVFSQEVPTEKRVSASDFLICRGNGNPSLVGRGFFPPSDMPDVVFPDTMIAARVDERALARGFFEAVWNGDSVRHQLETRARTTNGTFKVNQQAIESIELPLPPISAQHAFEDRRKALAAEEQSAARHAAALDLLFNSLQHRAFRGEL